jgi:hypothetical protein
MLKYGVGGHDLSDSCSNSDGQATANDSGNDGRGGGCSSGYNEKDDANEYWALWEENDHDFYVIPFCGSSGYNPLQNGQMPVSAHDFLCFFSATLQK